MSLERAGPDRDACLMGNTALRRIRKAKKLTLEQLAERTGISISMLSRMETGDRGITLEHVPVLTEALGARPSELLETVPKDVPLVGYVGAGAEAHFYATADDPNETVPAPDNWTPNMVAVEIRGESLGELFDHWIVFYDQVKTPVTADMIGRLCVVGLPDGRVLVKKIKASRSHGLYHLLSNTEGPILDVEVEWAAKVKTMVPR